jgi:hypothetical protein
MSYAKGSLMDFRVEKVLAQLQTEFMVMPGVCGVLFFGSAQHGQIGQHSDIDLYVLTTGEREWHEGRIIEGMIVELSFSPLRCMRDRIAGLNPTTTHAFATGAVVMDQRGEVNMLVIEARQRWNEGPAEMAPSDRLRWRFRLTDILHDLLDQPFESLEARCIASQLVALAIEAAFAFHRLWPVARKHLFVRLRHDLPTLAPLVECYYASSSVLDAIAISRHVLQEFGGLLLEYRTEDRMC